MFGSSPTYLASAVAFKELNDVILRADFTLSVWIRLTANITTPLYLVVVVADTVAERAS